MAIANLPKLLQPALKALEKDLLARAKSGPVEEGLKAAWTEEQKAGQTGLGFDPWRRERVTQLAVAWILSVVFVRTLEDRGYVDPRVAGSTGEALRAAEDREALFLQVAPFLGPREYLLAVFRELARLPGARDVFDTRHNPVWVLAPSSEGAKALLDFFRRRDASGAPELVFTGTDTRFLGDLYQDLSEAVRKRYALLQTPDFVEEFILDQTLDPAIQEFGLADVTLIDPTCGSGHFLLGAFRRLLGRWQAERPGDHVADLARRALDQVYGVDINPYAVAIARFRLVLAVLDAVGIKRLERAPDLKPNVVVADSLLHRFEQQVLTAGQMSLDDDLQWGDRLFRLENRAEVERVLTRRYHAVVGNPPYITEKDAAKKRRFKDLYVSASGRWALGAPFTERFFGLAAADGFIGMINTNAWSKRDYGKALIETVLPRFDIRKVIDTSGCYLPGHGTPTLMMFGRNRPPTEAPVPAVLGKRGEQDVPPDPARAPVWSEITACHDSLGFDGRYVSVESLDRAEARRHPWVLAGGGARILRARLEECAPTALEDVTATVGLDANTRASDLLEIPLSCYKRLGVEADPLLPYVNGDIVRDWAFNDVGIHVPVPYTRDGWELWDSLTPAPGLERFLWPHRAWLAVRFVSGGTRLLDVGKPFWAIPQLPIEKHREPRRLAWGFVSTHNHFLLDRGTRLFKQSAPIITTSRDETEDQSLLGYLNSSVVAFWCRLVMFPKGGDQVGDGARLSKAPWQDRLEFAGNLLRQLPVPYIESLRAALLELVAVAERTAQQMAEQSAEKVVARAFANNPSLDELRATRSSSVVERARLRGVLVSLQEEMDWRIYGLFGLPTVVAPSAEVVRVPVEPNCRPFELRLAREVATDISAAEWFRVHKREPLAEVNGPLAELYRQRLRLLDDPEHGKQLRLLEAPETKRRWPPPENDKAFDNAVRTWLLEQIEGWFRRQEAPELRTARQLAFELSGVPGVQAAHELLTEKTGLDLVRLISDMVDEEGVPFLAGLRYAETGMEKRASWEETWRLQRLEDSGKLEPELKRLGLKAIPVPEKYGPKDFLHHYWGLRGRVDVPKERFVTVPGGNAEEDATPLVGWRGWNHLQLAQALSGLYQRRKTDDGWTDERLIPLLAGLDEQVPWLLQWHNEPSEAFGGMKVGDFFRDFVAGEAHALGVAVGELKRWTPPATPRRTTVDPGEVLEALRRWKPEAVEDDEEDEEVEPPAGPTQAELATEAGVSQALVKKALKKLEADGLVEKLAGRPARWVAPGEDA